MKTGLSGKPREGYPHQKPGTLAGLILLLCLFTSGINALSVTPRQMIFKTTQSIIVRGDRTGITA
ncbi:MAG: hypothetical protein U1C33_06830, partial [Candidatus Cloacimonadaceae bacterium]|nr:hypothetical protein [Candidatus Cloacimonadaceae bacterium]